MRASAREPRQLRGAHHLVAHQDVGNAAPGQRLGLRHLLHALADRAARHLQLRDHRRLVRLGVRPQLRPGRRQQFRHVVEIGLERVEVDQQRGRIDFVLAHAGSGWRWLQHGDLTPLAFHGAARAGRCDPGVGCSLAVRRGHDNPRQAIVGPFISRQPSQRARRSSPPPRRRAARSGTLRRAKQRVASRAAKPEQSVSKLGVAAPHRQSAVVEQRSVKEEAQSLTPLVSLPYSIGTYTRSSHCGGAASASAAPSCCPSETADTVRRMTRK